jgi:hypothetical protein
MSCIWAVCVCLCQEPGDWGWPPPNSSMGLVACLWLVHLGHGMPTSPPHQLLAPQSTEPWGLGPCASTKWHRPPHIGFNLTQFLTQAPPSTTWCDNCVLLRGVTTAQSLTYLVLTCAATAAAAAAACS